MMRNDFRAGLTAAIQRGNPDLSADDARHRVDAVAAYVTHEAAQARLEEWIADRPGADAEALGERLVITYQGDGSWFTSDLLERGRELLVRGLSEDRDRLLESLRNEHPDAPLVEQLEHRDVPHQEGPEVYRNLSRHQIGEHVPIADRIDADWELVREQPQGVPRAGAERQVRQLARFDAVLGEAL